MKMKFMIFMMRRRANIIMFAFALACLSLSLYLSACAGTFLSDAPGVLSAILAGLSVLSGVLAFIPGLPAILGTAIAAAVGAIQEIETLVNEYKSDPSESTLTKIEDLISTAVANLQQLLTTEGLSSALATKVAQIAQTILDELESWAALITSLKPSAPSGSEVRVHAEFPKPLSAKALTVKLRTIVDTPTGDAEVDAAFAKASVQLQKLSE